MRYLMIAALAAALLCAPGLRAQEQPEADAAGQTEAAAADEGMQAELAQFIASLNFQQGEVKLPGAEATLKLQGDMRFLSGADAQKVLTGLWGNPPGAEPLGMVLPHQNAILEDGTYAIVLTYNDEGYVSDEEAAGIDYDQMLKQLQEETLGENDARKEAGYPTVALIGWAARPHYDSSSNKIYWAKELQFNDSPEHTLNYDVRVLGRRGYLSMNAVAGMKQLTTIEQALPSLIGMVEFDSGARYADYQPGKDKAAAYGLAALVAGGVAAKAGLFGKIGALLLAGKKFVVLAIVGIAAGIAKLRGRNAQKGA